MGLITWIKAVWNKLFKREILEKFDTDLLLSDQMQGWIDKFYNITSGKPPWIDPDDDIESINFAGFIDDVTAGLVTLDIGIEMPNTARGQYLQKQADYVLQVINDKVSEALGNCGLMFKPNGTNIDYMEPGTFAPTEIDSNGNILGCVFQTQVRKKDVTYTRLEWHRFEDRQNEGTGPDRMYRITNYAYKNKGTNANSIGDQCSLSEVPEWSGLVEDVYLDNIDRPLFAYFKNPSPNRLDRSSPLGVPVWHNALKELKDLDIAWSRKSTEVEDSKHQMIVPESSIIYANQHNVKIPRYVKGMQIASGIDGEQIHEHVATLLTEQRISDINSILALISTKCGYSQGMFVLDEKTGMMTATQVEADDQETIRTIKNIRDQLLDALNNLFYSINVMSDIYTELPAEDWNTLEESIVYNWGDITYSYEEDKASWWKYRIQGDVPAWMYYVKFEGMSEDDARAMVEEAQPDNPTLWGTEE